MAIPSLLKNWLHSEREKCQLNHRIFETDLLFLHFLLSSSNSWIDDEDALGQAYFNVSPSVNGCFSWYFMRSPKIKSVLVLITYSVNYYSKNAPHLLSNFSTTAGWVSTPQWCSTVFTMYKNVEEFVSNIVFPSFELFNWNKSKENRIANTSYF